MPHRAEPDDTSCVRVCVFVCVSRFSIIFFVVCVISVCETSESCVAAHTKVFGSGRIDFRQHLGRERNRKKGIKV